MKRPYYQDNFVTIYHGDAREVAEEIDEPSLIVCDPPYGRNCDLNTAGERIVGDHSTDLRDWLIARFPAADKMIFGSPLVRSPDCSLKLIWDKSELTGMGNLQLPWKLTHEEIYVFGSSFMASRRGGSVLDFPLRPAWTNHPDAVSGEHPNEKPVSLMVYLLSCCDPARIPVDYFCGIGSTLRAAKDLGRKAIGIEIEERYCEIAARRMGQEVLSFGG